MYRRFLRDLLDHALTDLSGRSPLLPTRSASLDRLARVWTCGCLGLPLLSSRPRSLRRVTVSHTKHLTCQLRTGPVTASSAPACDHRAPLCLIATQPISLRSHPRSASLSARLLASLIWCFAFTVVVDLLPAHAVLTSSPLSAYSALGFTNPHNTFTNLLAGLEPGTNPTCSLEDTTDRAFDT